MQGGSYGRAQCAKCGTGFGYIQGKVRSQGGRIVQRGGTLKEWQLRYYVQPEGEALLDFIGHRDIEVKAKDDFVFIQTDDAKHSVFCNLTLGNSWAYQSAAGCCLPAVLLLCLLLFAIVVLLQ